MKALAKKLRLSGPAPRRSRAPYAALAAVALLGSGCAFMSKGDALTPRFFSPALAVEPAESLAAPGAPAPLELRLGNIEPAAYLEERIAYRVSDTELAYHEDRRWTEPPEQFVRRALERELFESHAFRRIISGTAPTLDVEVLSFEEVRQGTPRAQLSLLITLRNERQALLQRTVSMQAPLEPGPDDGPALARAMADALARASRDVAKRVAAELRLQPTSAIAAHGVDERSQAPAE